MAKVEIKKPIVDEIIECLNGAKSAVLADYRGLTVEQDTALRKKMREAGVIYKVYKNTMIKRAVAGTEFEALYQTLKVLQQSLFLRKMQQLLQESFSDLLRLLMHYSLNQVLLKEHIMMRRYPGNCYYPSREELLSKFLGSIQSPVTNFARVIKQIAEKNEAEA